MSRSRWYGKGGGGLAAFCCLGMLLATVSVGAAEPVTATVVDEHAGHAVHGTVGVATPLTIQTDQGHGSDAEPLRDPDAYAEGVGFGPLPRVAMGDQHLFGGVLLNRLEGQWHHDGPPVWLYDLQAWYGRSFGRLLLRSEGEFTGSELDMTRTELYWAQAFSAYWDALIGLRVDLGDQPGQSWLALGVQGLTPYWIELKAGLYLGHTGQVAAKLEAEYEQLVTQRLVLQPRVELKLHSRRDVDRETGAGLSELSAGVRMRYECSREVAPYLGVEWHSLYGETRDIKGKSGDIRLLGGVRLRF